MLPNSFAATAAAILSAVFYGVSVPLVKLYGNGVPSAWLSAILYFGAGLAMVVLSTSLRASGKRKTLGGAPLTAQQAPLLALMVTLNVASAIALMAGISLTDASTASLLGNLEVAATAAFAWLLFREPAGRHLVAAICAITISGFLLCWNEDSSLFSPGALLIVLACVFLGSGEHLHPRTREIRRDCRHPHQRTAHRRRLGYHGAGIKRGMCRRKHPRTPHCWRRLLWREYRALHLGTTAYRRSQDR